MIVFNAITIVLSWFTAYVITFPSVSIIFMDSICRFCKLLEMKYDLCCSVISLFIFNLLFSSPIWYPFLMPQSLIPQKHFIDKCAQNVKMYLQQLYRSIYSIILFTTSANTDTHIELSIIRFKMKSAVKSKTVIPKASLHICSDGATILFTLGLRICPLTHSCVDFEQYFCTFNKWLSILFNQLLSEMFLLQRG